MAEFTKPVSPEKAIRRISRMHAINENFVKDISQNAGYIGCAKSW